MLLLLLWWRGLGFTKHSKPVSPSENERGVRASGLTTPSSGQRGFQIRGVGSLGSKQIGMGMNGKKLHSV